MYMGWGDAVLRFGTRGALEMPSFMETRWATARRRVFFLFGVTVGIGSYLCLYGAEEGQSTRRRAAGEGNRRSSRSVSVAEPIS